MKTIKSAIIGIKKIETTEPEEQLAQLCEILTAHNHVLVDRLLRDLPTYIHYKFKIRLLKEQLDEIKEKLLDLKKGNVNMDKYKSVINEVRTKAVIYLNNDVFYNEIDQLILFSLQKENDLKTELEETVTPFILS
jgi:hypothetical protein